MDEQTTFALGMLILGLSMGGGLVAVAGPVMAMQSAKQVLTANGIDISNLEPLKLEDDESKILFASNVIYNVNPASNNALVQGEFTLTNRHVAFCFPGNSTRPSGCLSAIVSDLLLYATSGMVIFSTEHRYLRSVELISDTEFAIVETDGDSRRFLLPMPKASEWCDLLEKAIQEASHV